MGNFIRNRLAHGVTVVSNEFIDRYMARANGEYVKVYLYILRNGGEVDSVAAIADALNHTEADVRRALIYWEQEGVLELGDNRQEAVKETESRPSLSTSGQRQPEPSRMDPCSLSGNEEFSQLLYIAQKYLNKVFTPRDCQVFAWLYEGLGMSSELLEYLVEYCAQNGHSSVRYLETVAVSWHEKGIKTSQEARELGAAYSKDSFAVMRAFGINNRKAAPPEQAMIDKWFKEYGFAREIVLEACSRTITAIHSPSFQYADRVLRDWKKAGVKKMEDVRVLDARRQALVQENGGDKEKRLQRYNSASKDGGGKKNSQNQFHNFKQRDTDYDALMLKQVKEWVGGGRPRT